MKVADLKQRVSELESQVAFQKSLLDTFFTGNVPHGASLNHFILAKYGRMRLDERAKMPALLKK